MPIGVQFKRTSNTADTKSFFDLTSGNGITHGKNSLNSFKSEDYRLWGRTCWLSNALKQRRKCTCLYTCMHTTAEISIYNWTANATWFPFPHLVTLSCHLTKKTDLFSAHVNGMHLPFFSESQRVPIICCSSVFKWNPLFSASAITADVVGGILKVIVNPKNIICWNCTQHQAIQDVDEKCCFVRTDLEKFYIDLH